MKRDSAIHAFVSGRVQGVYYRGSLATVAKTLQLTGFVRNLPDGRVEYVAMGEEKALAELRRWSRAGPAAADVVDVEVSAYRGDLVFDDFRVEY